MSLPAYPRYKNSGVDWLGHVPEHWTVHSVRYHVGAIFNGITAEQTEPGEHTVPVTRIETISRGVIDFEKLGHIPAQQARTDRLLATGDILFSNINSLNMIGNCALFTDSRPLYAGMNLLVLRATEHVNHLWLFWMIRSPLFRQTVESLAKPAINQASISQASLCSIDVATPPLEEQAEIAAFLNAETVKVDVLIQEQKRLVELLKEKRQAVISHAVTKGLNPDAHMKDSGIEWLGQIPATWQPSPLKRVSPEITVGIVVEPSKYYRDEGVPALRSLNIHPGEIRPENLVYISPEANARLRKSRLNSGDLVIVRSGQPGTAAVVPPELDGCNCIDLIIIRRSEQANERFLCYFLASDYAVRQFREGSEGAIQQHFNVGTAMSLIVPLPPIAEQNEICDFLYRETHKIDELAKQAAHAVELLQERRTALISAAVTGKIDVRQAVAEVVA
jgi:type I restriction enzyme S subunit